MLGVGRWFSFKMGLSGSKDWTGTRDGASGPPCFYLTITASSRGGLIPISSGPGPSVALLIHAHSWSKTSSGSHHAASQGPRARPLTSPLQFQSSRFGQTHLRSHPSASAGWGRTQGGAVRGRRPGQKGFYHLCPPTQALLLPV